MSDRERGTMLRTLDPEYLQQQARGHLRVMVPEAEWVEARPVYRLAAGTDAEGDTYVVCTEGVGWQVDPYNRALALDVYIKWAENGQAHGGRSQATVFLSYEEVKRAMKKGEDVDLADLVREFGDRLESNFWLWHRKFNPAPKRTRKAAKK